MRFGLLGNTAFSEELASGFIDAGHTCSFTVSQPTSSLPDACIGVGRWAAKQRVPHFETDDVNGPEFASILDDFPADFMVSSWPKILHTNTISRLPLGVVGTHPTPLPWGRGRHPLHWAVAMGLPHTSLSMFLMDAGVDTGMLIAQSAILIEENATIAELQRALDAEVRVVARTVGEQLSSAGFFAGWPQSPVSGSLWRRRTEYDVQIDCRMSCDAVRRLVNSYSSPFPMARLLTKHGAILIDETLASNLPKAQWQFQVPGSILEVGDRWVTIRLDDGVLVLHSANGLPATLREGDSAPPLHSSSRRSPEPILYRRCEAA